MRIGSFWGARLWPTVLLVWALRLACLALPVGWVWAAWALTHDRNYVIGAVIFDLGFAWGALLLANDLPDHLPGDLGWRWALAWDPTARKHLWLALVVAKRDPGKGERLLRIGVAEGSDEHAVQLVELVRDRDRADDLEVLLRELAGTGTVQQLRAVVRHFTDGYRDGGRAVAAVSAVVTPLQGSVAARTDDEHDHELHAALLAEAGAFDEALAALGGGIRVRGGREPDSRSVELILRVG
jgi:hypothetical protein